MKCHRHHEVMSTSTNTNTHGDKIIRTGTKKRKMEIEKKNGRGKKQSI